MAEGRSSSSLAFIVGGLVVMVAVIAWVIFGGNGGSAPSEPDAQINIDLPDAAPEGGASQ